MALIRRAYISSVSWRRENGEEERDSVIPRFFFRNFSGSNGGSQLDAARARESIPSSGMKGTIAVPVLARARVLGRAEWNLWGSFIPALKGTVAGRRGRSLDLSLSNLLISPYFGTTVDDASRSAPWKRDHALAPDSRMRAPLPFLLKTVPWANRTSRACQEKKFNVGHKSRRAHFYAPASWEILKSLSSRS